MLEPTVIGTWIAVLIAVGSVIAGSVKFAFWAFDEWQKRKTHGGFSMPRDTLRLAQKMPGNCWWHMGKQGDDPTMQIVGSVFASNAAAVPVRVPQVELRYGVLGRHRLFGLAMVASGGTQRIYGMHDIPPNQTRDLKFDFWLFPPVCKPGEPFTAHSVTMLDQFGNRHKLKRVQFRSHDVDDQERPKEPEEFPYEIVDTLEREIVSVLKAERSRYQVCGRQAGGLGSVHIQYRGHTLNGTGGDSWTSNSPLNQVIVSDTEVALLKSDNLDALKSLHSRLDSDDARELFARALLERLDAKRGYLDIAYFIVLALWATGTLSRSLLRARQSLPTGDTRAFGLSNVLMLLNGLLKYRHPDFTNSNLDDIEKLTHGLDEHPFLIPAKLAAIRAGRLIAPQ